MTDMIVIGDGMIGVDMGGGYVEKVSGSRTAQREPTGGVFTDADAEREQRRAFGEILPADPNTKWCYACGETYAVTEFHADASRPDGRYPMCKHCKNARDRLRYAEQKRAAG